MLSTRKSIPLHNFQQGLKTYGIGHALSPGDTKFVWHFGCGLTAKEVVLLLLGLGAWHSPPT
jgi:hypothetical protein